MKARDRARVLPEEERMSDEARATLEQQVAELTRERDAARRDLVRVLAECAELRARLAAGEGPR